MQLKSLEKQISVCTETNQENGISPFFFTRFWS